MPNGTPGNVELGPGLLFCATIGTTEPTLASAALPSAWRQIGYTEDGSTFTWTVNVDPIPVEEEFDPIRYVTTGRSGKVEFQMAEATRQNLVLAINSGNTVTNDATTVEPPAPTTEVRVMLLWDALTVPAATNERWIFRQCFQGGDLAIARKKAPDKTLLPVSFMLEKPATLQPWICMPGPTGLI